MAMVAVIAFGVSLWRRDAAQREVGRRGERGD
jgi:hypothetical protein